MGVYINMEMPETCYECPCGDNEFYECCATKDRLSYHRDEFGYTDGERQDWCPLIPVPPHGRLIDADAAYEQFLNLMDIQGAINPCQLGTILDGAPTIIEAEPTQSNAPNTLDALTNAQTIIPADEPDMDSFIRIFEEDDEEDGMDSFIRIFKD